MANLFNSMLLGSNSPLPGMTLWLDASQQATGALATWFDLSGNGNNAVQATGGSQPTNTANQQHGRNGVVFNGTSDNMTCPNAVRNAVAVGTAHTIFCVTSATTFTGTGATGHSIFSSALGGSDRSCLQANTQTGNQICSSYYNGSTFSSASSGAINPSTPYLITVTHAASSSPAMYVNSVLSAQTTNGSLNGNTTFMIGADNNGTDRFFSGNIYELIIYPSVLSANQLTQVNNYLTAKWGIAIPFSLSPVLWLDASQTPVGAVSSWTDLSGNSNNATQGNGSAQPICTANQQNSLNTIIFNGTNQELDLPSNFLSIPTNNNTVFCVSKRNTETGSAVIPLAVGQNGIGQKWGFEYSATSGNVTFQNGDDGVQVTNTGGTNTNYQILTGRRNNTTLGISINHGTEATNTSATNGTSCDLARIGDIFGANWLAGGIGEIIIFTRSLSATEITSINQYLAQKWGITIS